MTTQAWTLLGLALLALGETTRELDTDKRLRLLTFALATIALAIALAKTVF